MRLRQACTSASCSLSHRQSLRWSLTGNPSHSSRTASYRQVPVACCISTWYQSGQGHPSTAAVRRHTQLHIHTACPLAHCHGKAAEEHEQLILVGVSTHLPLAPRTGCCLCRLELQPGEIVQLLHSWHDASAAVRQVLYAAAQQQPVDYQEIFKVGLQLELLILVCCARCAGRHNPQHLMSIMASSHATA